MASLGMGLLGLEPGRAHQGLHVVVETARCATDAIQATTVCSLGRHTLKLHEFGKMAATFAFEGREDAIRVLVLESSRGEADRRHPEVENRRARQLAAYREMDDDSLFAVVRVRLLESLEAPHKAPRTKAVCASCGETFEESRGLRRGEATVCAGCGGSAYCRAIPELLTP
jgi:formylmethanofuran dehydrogenase subunit E